MADFPSTNVRINSQLSPFTDTQTFPLFDTAHGLGGMRTVGTTADLNNIFDRRRTRGMMVYVSGVSAYYALIGTTANSGWTTEFQIGTGTNILPLNNTFTGTNIFNGAVTIGAGATFTVEGNLLVNGTTTTINSTTITVDDKNIELGSVSSPTDTTANGGGISLRGNDLYTITWSNSRGGKTLDSAWNFNQDVNLTKSTNPSYNIDGNPVLTASALGTGVTSSSLQSVGTISSGTWQGTRIAANYGGTGLTAYGKGDLLVGTNSATSLGTVSFVNVDGYLLTSSGNNVTWAELTIQNASGTKVSELNGGAYRIANASSTTRGLASFDSVNFTVSSGAVSIDTIEGGTY